MENSFFIEPSTGCRYELNHSPYLEVDSIFNDKNYWINMDTTTPIEDIDF